MKVIRMWPGYVNVTCWLSQPHNWIYHNSTTTVSTPSRTLTALSVQHTWCVLWDLPIGAQFPARRAICPFWRVQTASGVNSASHKRPPRSFLWHKAAGNAVGQSPAIRPASWPNTSYTASQLAKHLYMLPA